MPVTGATGALHTAEAAAAEVPRGLALHPRVKRRGLELVCLGQWAAAAGCRFCRARTTITGTLLPVTASKLLWVRRTTGPPFSYRAIAPPASSASRSARGSGDPAMVRSNQN